MDQLRHALKRYNFIFSVEQHINTNAVYSDQHDLWAVTIFTARSWAVTIFLVPTTCIPDHYSPQNLLFTAFSSQYKYAVVGRLDLLAFTLWRMSLNHFEDSMHPRENTGVAQTSHVQKCSWSHTEGSFGHIEGRFRAARYSHRLQCICFSIAGMYQHPFT